jgi:anti-sigma factor RsiW
MTNIANDEAAEERMVQYVLGELPRAEAEVFEAHLAADAALRGEVDRLRGALGLLAFASATEPPPQLRANVLRAARERASATRAPAVARPRGGSSGAGSRRRPPRRLRSRSATTPIACAPSSRSSAR